jgi:hypothetical protein
MDEKHVRQRFSFGLTSLFALAAAVGLLACFWNPLPNPSRSNLGLIEVGMTVAEVEELVGNPDDGTIDLARGRLIYGYQVINGEKWFIVFDDGKVARDQHIVRTPITAPASSSKALPERREASRGAGPAMRALLGGVAADASSRVLVPCLACAPRSHPFVPSGW